MNNALRPIFRLPKPDEIVYMIDLIQQLHRGQPVIIPIRIPQDKLKGDNQHENVC